MTVKDGGYLKKKYTSQHHVMQQLRVQMPTIRHAFCILFTNKIVYRLE